ncbi:MAG: hypothetical protein ABFR05_00130 [Bacteroidota bacterium]
MKRKSIKYGKNGLLIFGFSNAFINAVQQLNSIKENPEQKFDWTRLIKAGGKGALIGGIGGAFVGELADIENSKEKPLNTSSILLKVVSNVRLNKKNPKYLIMSNKGSRISRLIQTNFKSKLSGSPIKIGSTEDGTSLSDEFDIDITVAFNSNSYNSTNEMFDTMYKFLDINYTDYDLIKIRKQKKSIGILYEIEGDDYKIDIVPYKISKNIRNKTQGYLFVNNNSLFKNDSYTKTDITSLKGISLNNSQQKLLIAFKNWKKEYSIPISSHLLKMFIIDAYDFNRGFIPRDFTNKIIMIVKYIKDNILTRRIVSVENTNNILTNFDDSDKLLIEKECSMVLCDFDYQPNSILKYFSVQ